MPPPDWPDNMSQTVTDKHYEGGCLCGAVRFRGTGTPEGAIRMLIALSEGHDAGDFADSLLVLREDLRDPPLRARGRRWGLGLSAALSRRFAQCARPPADIGHLMLAQWQGIILLWGFAQDRSVAEVVEDGLRRFCAAMTVPASPPA